MSLIADALRKAEQGSPPAPSRQEALPGPNLWVYRALLVAGVAVVLAALALVSRPRPAATVKPAQRLPALSPAPDQPRAQQGLFQKTSPGFSLQGIVVGGDGRPLALINNAVVAEGDSVGKARVIRVAKDQVELEEEGRTRTLALQD